MPLNAGVRRELADGIRALAELEGKPQAELLEQALEMLLDLYGRQRVAALVVRHRAARGL